MWTSFPPFFLWFTMTSIGSRIPTILLFIICYAFGVFAENVEIVTPENTKTVTVSPQNVTMAPNDSYVKAYEEVQKLRSGPASRNDFYEPPDKNKDKQGAYNTVIRSSYLFDDKYPSLTHQRVPAHAASPPSFAYGPPHSHHIASDALPCRPIPYSSPSDSYLGFLPKKLSLKILLKILLKLVLFKMIVKFIAVICLLLFIPALKSNETSAENEGDEKRKTRDLNTMADLIWGSIEEKNSLYEEDEEMKDIREIAEEADDDEDEKENAFSGPLKAVKFLEFCVSAVDRVVGYILGVLKRQRNENDDLSTFVFEKLSDFVKNL